MEETTFILTFSDSPILHLKSFLKVIRHLFAFLKCEVRDYKPGNLFASCLYPVSMHNLGQIASLSCPLIFL